MSSRVRVVIVLFILLVSALQVVAPVNGQAGPSPDPIWWNEDYRYRLLVEVDPMPFTMTNHPVEMDVNFSDVIDQQSIRLDVHSIIIIEFDGPHGGSRAIKRKDVSDPLEAFSVPYRFYPVHDFHPSSNAKGTISWILDGSTTSTRYFHIYFDDVLGPPKKQVDHGDELALIDSQYWIQRGMVFYGFNPGEQKDWMDIDDIQVIGLHDGTTVEVWNITGTVQPLLPEHDLDRGDLVKFNVPDGTYFKLTSNRPIVASVSSALFDAGSAKTFYPSADRDLVGKDFLFAPYHQPDWNDQKHGTNIYAFEDTKVVIDEIDGDYELSMAIDRGGFWEIEDLEAGKVYNIRSTGNIAIEQKAINGFAAVPSITGSPVGKTFYTSIEAFDGTQVILFSYESTSYAITDLETGQQVHTGSVAGLKSMGLGFIEEGTYRIESVGNISLMVGSTEGGIGVKNLGDDITFSGGLGGREIRTQSIGNPGPGKKDDGYPTLPYSGIVFSYRDGTRVDVDGTLHVLDSDGWLGLEKGYHKIDSDRPISVMSLGRGYQEDAEHRWNDWGTYLAGTLTSPEAFITAAQYLRVGIDLYPHPSEGTTNDTMVHAVEPGHSTVFRMNIRNTGTLDHEYGVNTTPVPNGWTAVLDKDQLVVPSGLDREVLLTVTVPPDARSLTRVNITVNGWSLEQPDIMDNVFAEAVVDPVHFPFLSGEYLKYVDPGGTARFNISLTNQGNGFDNITLEMVSTVAPGWSGALSLSEVRLDSNESVHFALRVTAPGTALAGDELVIDIRALSKGNSSRSYIHRTRTIVNQIFDFNATAVELVEVLPDNVGQINVSVVNLGNGDDEFNMEVQGLRPGWNALYPDPVTIGPRKEQLLKIEFKVPGWNETAGSWAEPAGDHDVLITIVDLAGIEKRLDVVIRVLQVYRIDLYTDEDEKTVGPEEDAFFLLKVRNLGNGEDTINISSLADVRFANGSVTLAPNEVVTVRCTAPSSSDRGTIYKFMVIARSSGEVEDDLTLTVNIKRPGHSQTIGDYSCLWILLVALLIFSMIQVIKRLKGDMY